MRPLGRKNLASAGANRPAGIEEDLLKVWTKATLPGHGMRGVGNVTRQWDLQ